VAPSDSQRLYAEYKVPQYQLQDHFQLFAPSTYDVLSLIECVDEPPGRKIVTELHVELEEALKQSDPYTAFGCETITEITCQEFDDLSAQHGGHRAS
jgi:hypothetical protein